MIIISYESATNITPFSKEKNWKKNPMKQKDPKSHKQASLILDLSFTTYYTEKLNYIF